MAGVSLVNLPLDECHSTLVMISQHWFREWLGAVRQQAIAWANVDPDLCRHMASLVSDELKAPRRQLVINNYSDVIMGTMAFRSPASRLLTQPFIQAQIKENIKARRQWHSGESTGDRFHLMTSSWGCEELYRLTHHYISLLRFIELKVWRIYIKVFVWCKNWIFIEYLHIYIALSKHC